MRGRGLLTVSAVSLALACGDRAAPITKASGDPSGAPTPGPKPSTSARSTDELSITQGWFCRPFKAEMPFDAGPCTTDSAGHTSCPKNDHVTLLSSTCERTEDACARSSPPLPDGGPWSLSTSSPADGPCVHVDEAACLTPEGATKRRCFLNAKECEAFKKELKDSKASCEVTP